MQGGSWGPLQFSTSLDKIGKGCEEKREHLYTYKNMVKVPVLTMVDDMLAISTCSQESLSLNTHLNAQIEMKLSETFRNLKVHETNMKMVSENTYLGDLV